MTKAAQTIPPAHLDLIKMIAARVWRNLFARGRMLFSVDDLVSEGYLGYVQALNYFNASQGHGFVDYAQWRIRGAMIDAIRRMDPLTRHERAYLNRFEAVEARLAGQHGRPPSEEEIATALRITVKEYLALRERFHQIEECSLDQALEHYPNQLPPAPDEYLAVEEKITRQQLVERLRELLDQKVITLCTLLVVRMYLEKGLGQKDIAKAMGVTVSRISQRLAEAVIALRA